MSAHAPTNLKYELPSNVTEEQLKHHKAFNTWLSQTQKTLRLQEQPSHPFHSDPYQLHGVKVLACTWWKGKLGFLFAEHDIRNSQDRLPGVLFLRGGSVAMLIILSPEEAQHASERYVILTVQPRAAATSLGFVELPAGMIDDEDHTFAGTAAREIEEEAGLKIREDELVDLTDLAIRSNDDSGVEPHLHRGVYASAGASDEFIPIFLARKKLSKAAIELLRNKATGLREENEQITLKVVKLEDAWKEVARDSKGLSALALYEGLLREGKIQD